MQFVICNGELEPTDTITITVLLTLKTCNTVFFVSGGHHSQSGALRGVLWIHDSSQPQIQTRNSATQSHRFLHHTYA